MSSLSNSFQHHVPTVADRNEPTSRMTLAAAIAPRAVFKYSVVDGGVYTRAELTHAIARDPIVAEHYRGLDVKQVRGDTVRADQYVYMSYRRGDKVYWTKNRVKLEQGETILTDGNTQVRSRCGNCISLQPMQPTAPEEPAVAEFNALVDDPVVIASRPFSLYPTVPPGLLPRSAGIDFPQDGGFAAIAGFPFGAVAPPPDSDGGLAENLPPSGDPLTPGLTDPFFLPPGNPPGPPKDPPDPPSGTPRSTPPQGDPPAPPNDPPDTPSGTPRSAPPQGDPPIIVDDPPPLIPPGGDPPIVQPLDAETPVPAPEPSTLVLVGGGLAAIARSLRSRQAKSR